MATKNEDKPDAATAKDVTPEEKPNMLVETGVDGQAVASFDDDAFFDGDDGLENVGQEDVSLARLTILQGLSPQVNRRKDEYVEGAEIGMIMNTATGKVMDSGMVVVAAYERRNVEWTPREKPCPIEGYPTPTGGGLYKDYGTDDSVLEECVRWEENGSLWTPRGNELVVTGTWYVIDPTTMGRAFIGMGKTQFTPSKKWMAGITDEKIQTSKGIRQAPIFYRAWELGTTLRTHDGNEWFTWAHKSGPKLQDFVHGKDLLAEVRKFREEILEGSTIIDVSIGETDGQAAPASGDDARM